MFFTRLKQCPFCNETQHITKESNWKRNTMGIPLIFVPPILNISNVPWLWIGIIYFILVMIFLAFIPYQLRFTDEEQPLF